MLETVMTSLMSLANIPVAIAMVIIKIPIAILNVIPTPVREIKNWKHDVPKDIRESSWMIKGKLVHLGTLLIAWTRGDIRRVPYRDTDKKITGIWYDDLQAIKDKWCF